MPRTGDTIHIPLKPKEAIADLMKVKPTDDMPRLGSFKAGKKAKRKTA